MKIVQLANGRIKIGEATLTPNKDCFCIEENGDTETIEFWYAGQRVFWFLYSNITHTQLHGESEQAVPASREELCELLNESFLTP